MADTVTFPVTNDLPYREYLPANITVIEAFVLNIDETTNIPQTLDPRVTVANENAIITDACIGDDCNYIAKYIGAENGPYYSRGGRQSPTLNQIARNEINITQRASDLGIGPKVRHTALNDTRGIIIMDKYDGTLSDIIYKYQTDRTIPIEEILRKLFQLITRMHQHGIRHRDLHSGNIFYKNDGTYVIGDYGASVMSNSERLAQGDWHTYYDIVNTVREIKQGERKFFDTLQISFHLTEYDCLYYLMWEGNIYPTW